MAKRICPWWLGYLLASPLRRLMHDPAGILAPHVADRPPIHRSRVALLRKR